MMNPDRIALKLNGVVPLSDYAGVIDHFAQLISALSNEVAGKDRVRWEITHLEAGSALTEIRGYADDAQQVQRVIAAYAVVGEAIAQRTTIPYSFIVAEQARLLTSFINGHVKSIEFRVADQVATVAQPVAEAPAAERIYAVGTVTGQVDTLSKRRGYTFTLYDLIFDRAVTCYLYPEQEALMRNAWGKIATVGGEIWRDAETGRPLEVRNVTFVETEDEPATDPETPGYLAAFGALSGLLTNLPSETVIRGLRDAE
jgi:hypothetical protein